MRTGIFEQEMEKFSLMWEVHELFPLFYPLIGMPLVILQSQGVYLLSCPSKAWGDLCVLPATSPENDGITLFPFSPGLLPLLTLIWKYVSSNSKRRMQTYHSIGGTLPICGYFCERHGPSHLTPSPACCTLQPPLMAGYSCWSLAAANL